MLYMSMGTLPMHSSLNVLIAVREEVLEQCRRLPVFGIVALQSFRKRSRHGAVEERVFTVNLFAAAPTWITGEVRLRAPEHQDLAIIFRCLRDIPRFVSFDGGSLPDHLGIPGFADAGRLRKLGGVPMGRAAHQ